MKTGSISLPVFGICVVGLSMAACAWPPCAPGWAPSPLAPAQGQELPSDPAVSDEPWGVRQDVSGKNMQLGD